MTLKSGFSWRVLSVAHLRGQDQALAARACGHRHPFVVANGKIGGPDSRENSCPDERYSVRRVTPALSELPTNRSTFAESLAIALIRPPANDKMTRLDLSFLFSRELPCKS